MEKSQKQALIPEHAELVFEWVRTKIYQWDQEMYDGSIARFERTRFLDGAFVIPVLKNGKILLTKQEQPARTPFISLPGGGIEIEDDSPLISAQRELLEETWAKSHNWSEFFHFTGTNNVVSNVYYYIARDCEIVAPIMADAGEKISLFEVDFDEFLELSSNEEFHHHWNLLPIMYEARLKKDVYEDLKKKIFGK